MYNITMLLCLGLKSKPCPRQIFVMSGGFHLLFNPLTTDDAFWHCLTLAACYQLVQSILKIGFALAKKGGIGEGGRVSTLGAVRMASALAGCRTALVGTDWTIPHLVSTNTCRNHSSPLVGEPFLIQRMYCFTQY